MYSDNPIADFYRQDAEQCKRLERLPVCHNCKEPIQQEDAVCIDGDWFCDECLYGMREGIEDGWC